MGSNIVFQVQVLNHAYTHAAKARSRTNTRAHTDTVAFLSFRDFCPGGMTESYIIRKPAVSKNGARHNLFGKDKIEF